MGAQHYLPYSVQFDRLKSRIDTGISDEHLLNAIPCHAKDEEVFFDTFINVLASQKKILTELMDKSELDGKKLSENEVQVSGIGLIRLSGIFCGPAADTKLSFLFHISGKQAI